jgi:hypothetical protein
MAGMDALEMLGLDEMVRTERLYVTRCHPPTVWQQWRGHRELGVGEMIGYISSEREWLASQPQPKAKMGARVGRRA